MNLLKSSHLPLDRPSGVAPVFKPVGKTPLEMVEQYRAAHGIQSNVKISYAGRLDPMAEGLLLLLIGEENKKRGAYLNLPKTYVCAILFGISTDSFDVLGIIDRVQEVLLKRDKVEIACLKFQGRITQKFPPYSSKTVKGKPLYYWARVGKLDSIEIPEEEREISSIKVNDLLHVEGKDVYASAKKKIDAMQGNFRQEEIKAGWKQFVEKNKNRKFPIAEIEVSGSSGLYVRQLAVDIGIALNVPAMAYSINRTSIGSYTLSTPKTQSQEQ